jgi:hypothetical protein
MTECRVKALLLTSTRVPVAEIGVSRRLVIDAILQCHIL